MTKTYRQGAVGAMMDEYERAIAELLRILEGISDEEFERIRDTKTQDENCRSIQTILTHVVSAGYGYAGMLRDAWGAARGDPKREPFARADASARIRKMLDYTSATLEGKWNLTEAEMEAVQMRSRWGPMYDFEQIFEHAIVHVLRHRRQIERFLGR